MIKNTIQFTEPFDKEFTFQSGLLRWEIYARNQKKLVKSYIIMIISIILLILLSTGNPKIVNLLVYMGVGLGVFAFFQFYFFITQKDNYKKKITQLCEREILNSNDCSFEISESKFIYQDAEKRYEFKWSVFVNYSVYKNHLLLWIDGSPLTTFIFKEDKEGLTLEKYNQLLELIKSKLPYKELK